MKNIKIENKQLLVSCWKKIIIILIILAENTTKSFRVRVNYARKILDKRLSKTIKTLNEKGEIYSDKNIVSSKTSSY